MSKEDHDHTETYYPAVTFDVAAVAAFGLEEVYAPENMRRSAAEFLEVTSDLDRVIGNDAGVVLIARWLRDPFKVPPLIFGWSDEYGTGLKWDRLQPTTPGRFVHYECVLRDLLFTRTSNPAGLRAKALGIRDGFEAVEAQSKEAGEAFDKGGWLKEYALASLLTDILREQVQVPSVSRRMSDEWQAKQEAARLQEASN